MMSEPLRRKIIYPREIQKKSNKCFKTLNNLLTFLENLSRYFSFFCRSSILFSNEIM